MQKNAVWVVIISCLILLGGCQSGPMSSGIPSSIFPSPSFGATADLSQSVQEALMRHDELAVSPIRVETRDNIVILSGYVKKIRQSDTAELIARQVPGVQGVENRIIVRP